MGKGYDTPLPLMLSDLLAAGVTSGVATRLRKLTGIEGAAACDVQQLQALRQCTGLTHLNISGGCLRDCLAVEMTATLQAMPKLQHLHLAGPRFGEAGLAALASALSAMPGLQTFHFIYSLISGAEGATALCTLLGAVPGLMHLDVSYSRLRDEGTALLAAVLQGMTRLQTLNMRGAQIGDVGMVTLAPALAALTHLDTLDLSVNELGTSAVSMLQPVMVREVNPLRELYLSFNNFKAKGTQSFASVLSTATQLRTLNLSNTVLATEDWVALAPALSRLGPSLMSLELGGRGFDTARSAGLASALEALTGLTSLKATGCFRSTTTITIWLALISMRRLQVLDMSNNAMSAASTPAVASVLLALDGSLRQLNLSHCRFDIEAAANALAPALAQATGLVKLHLDCISYGPRGAQLLVPVLSALPHLREVNLKLCKLGVQGCMAVARALKDRDGAHVDLGGNGVTVGSAEHFELCNMSGINVHV